ncbi:MAG: low affinity iron permease family protein [Pirellulaceae bacterium]
MPFTESNGFVSSHWGTLAALGVLAIWLVAIPLLGPSRAWDLVDNIIFATSFLLLFLLQRSQTKATLSIQLSSTNYWRRPIGPAPTDQYRGQE